MLGTSGGKAAALAGAASTINSSSAAKHRVIP
jgi:hypothetical protein